MSNLLDKASKVRLLAFDVDGVLTDGSITYDENGIEYKTFNAKDGYGLAKMTKNGFITAIITGRRSGTVDKRATDLKVTEVFADESKTLRRGRPRAQGRMYARVKRTSHLTLTVGKA